MRKTKDKIKVLFLCTGNSCRSQLAEGWARHLKSDVMDVYSAGVDPGQINTKAIAIMAEAGVDISMQQPKHLDTLKGIDFDYVVTLCNDAREQCPIFPSCPKHIHQLFTDPSFMDSSEDEIMAAFRNLRDEIRKFIETMPDSLISEIL